MSHWGTGPELGLLTLLGNLVGMLGLRLLWSNRGEAFLWMLDEVGAFRRDLSRHATIGPFYAIRPESRLRLIPSTLLRSLTRLPRLQIQVAGFLLFLGSALFILDFFV